MDMSFQFFQICNHTNQYNNSIHTIITTAYKLLSHYILSPTKVIQTTYSSTTYSNMTYPLVNWTTQPGTSSTALANAFSDIETMLIPQVPRPGLIPQVPRPGPITAVVTGDLPHRPGCSAQCHSCVSQSHNAMHVQHSLSCGILWGCHFSPSLQNLSCPIHLQLQCPSNS